MIAPPGLPRPRKFSIKHKRSLEVPNGYEPEVAAELMYLACSVAYRKVLGDSLDLASGLKWSKIEPGSLKASGLEWENIGTQKPTTGELLDNPELSKKLEDKTKFTQDEWQKYVRKDPRRGQFIKAGDEYFRISMKPVGEELKNSVLSEKLETQTEFTQEEWEKLNIKDVLRMDQFIKSGDNYFQPAVMKASGRKWENIGTQKPTSGDELNISDLSKALEALEEDKKELTKDEWEKFNIKYLHMDHFIKSGDAYFRPSMTFYYEKYDVVETERDSDMDESAMALFKKPEYNSTTKTYTPPRVYFVFRGSSNLPDWIDNLSLFAVPPEAMPRYLSAKNKGKRFSLTNPSGYSMIPPAIGSAYSDPWGERAHAGFALRAAMRELFMRQFIERLGGSGGIKAPLLNKNEPLCVYITGHSLGGAAASVAAFRLARALQRLTEIEQANHKEGEGSGERPKSRLLRHPPGSDLDNSPELKPVLPKNIQGGRGLSALAAFTDDIHQDERLPQGWWPSRGNAQPSKAFGKLMPKQTFVALYTFSAPRVANYKMRKHCDDLLIYAFTHRVLGDPVPNVPPWYYNIGTEIVFTCKGSKWCHPPKLCSQTSEMVFKNQAGWAWGPLWWLFNLIPFNLMHVHTAPSRVFASYFRTLKANTKGQNLASEMIVDKGVTDTDEVTLRQWAFANKTNESVLHKGKKPTGEDKELGKARIKAVDALVAIDMPFGENEDESTAGKNKLLEARVDYNWQWQERRPVYLRAFYFFLLNRFFDLFLPLFFTILPALLHKIVMKSLGLTMVSISITWRVLFSNLPLGAYVGGFVGPLIFNEIAKKFDNIHWFYLPLCWLLTSTLLGGLQLWLLPPVFAGPLNGGTMFLYINSTIVAFIALFILLVLVAEFCFRPMDGWCYTGYNDHNAKSAVLKRVDALLLADAAKGDQKLLVDAVPSDAAVGSSLVLNPGKKNGTTNKNVETVTIAGFGSILLAQPLRFDHVAGEPIYLHKPSRKLKKKHLKPEWTLDKNGKPNWEIKAFSTPEQLELLDKLAEKHDEPRVPSNEEDEEFLRLAARGPAETMGTAWDQPLPEQTMSLLENGVNVNAPDPNTGETAITIASLYGYWSMVKELIRAGADVDVQNQKSKLWTPLMYAVAGVFEQGNVEVVKTLLEAGADRSLKQEDRKTALVIAHDCENAWAIELLWDPDAKTEPEPEPEPELPTPATGTYSLPAVDGEHMDHAPGTWPKHPWAQILLEGNWASHYDRGTLSVRWKDQGFGNRKGHLWARVTGDTVREWFRLSTTAAPHEWESQTFPIPPDWFNPSMDEELQAEGGTLELLYEVGGGGGHRLFVEEGAILSLVPRVVTAGSAV